MPQLKTGLLYDTTIIYLTGKPGVGKYTIAKELAANHGFIVCDNQMINNPIFEQNACPAPEINGVAQAFCSIGFF
jgi:dephospho-CoA kinase